MFFGLIVIITTNSCSKNEKIENVYNLKANEIILQVLQQNNCNCLLEIPDKSLIEISNGENPSYDIRNFLKSCLLYTSPSPRDLSTSRMPSSA